jgi:glycosyltransferase involved in cell wall biosynthesis
MTIKLVHVINTLDLGGAEMTLCQLTTQMDQTLYDIVVISMKGQDLLAASLRDRNIRVYSLQIRNILHAPWKLWRLFRILRREKPDLLMSWLHISDLTAFVVGGLAGISTIIWNLRCSDMGPNYYGGWRGHMIKLLAFVSPRVDAIIVNSLAGQQKHIELGYHPKKWIYIPNGVQTERFRPNPEACLLLRKSLNVGASTRIIGLVARYDPIKGHQMFLEAAKIIAATAPDVHFVMVGLGVDKENAELNKLISNIGLSNRVHLLGRQQEIAAITVGFDIATCCSRGEGFPGVLVEAMACGVPCVSTNVGDAAYILGGHDYLVEDRNVNMFAAKCLALLAIPDSEISELKAKVRERAVKEFDLPLTVKKYQEVITEYVVSG